MTENELRAISGKYSKIYFQILDKRRTIPVSKEVYSEEHHVVPASLGGSDGKENLVRITAREHFICHYLLVRMLEGKKGKYEKMLSAFIIMAADPKGSTCRYVNSRLYARYKMEFSELQRIRNSGKSNASYGTVWLTNPGTKEIKRVINCEVASWVSLGWLIGRIKIWEVSSWKDALFVAYRKTYALRGKEFTLEEIDTLVSVSREGSLGKRYLHNLALCGRIENTLHGNASVILPTVSSFRSELAKLALEVSKLRRKKRESLGVDLVTKIKNSGYSSLTDYLRYTGYSCLPSFIQSLKKMLSAEQYADLRRYLIEKKKSTIEIESKKNEGSDIKELHPEEQEEAKQILKEIEKGDYYSLENYAKVSTFNKDVSVLKNFLARHANLAEYKRLRAILKGRSIKQSRSLGRFFIPSTKGKRNYLKFFTLEQQSEIIRSTEPATALAKRFGVDRSVIRTIKADHAARLTYNSA